MHSDLLYVENSNLESGNKKNPRKMPNIVHHAIYRLDLQRNVSLLSVMGKLLFKVTSYILHITCS